jgi:hypothetical protein
VCAILAMKIVKPSDSIHSNGSLFTHPPLCLRASGTLCQTSTRIGQMLPMTHRSLLVIGFVRAVGSVCAQTIGRLDRYSPAHRRFLSSGFVCEKCGERLLRKWWAADVVCYDDQSKLVPLTEVRLRGRSFECPKCLHRWPFRSVHRAIQP